MKTTKEKIEEILLVHKDWGYKKVASELGLAYSSARYHMNPRYRENSHNRIIKRRQEIVDSARIAAGGKCSLCGYSKCLSALHFHHTSDDKIDDVARLARLAGARKTEEFLDAEIKKCILVCANCHAELHNKERIRL